MDEQKIIERNVALLAYRLRGEGDEPVWKGYAVSEPWLPDRPTIVRDGKEEEDMMFCYDSETGLLEPPRFYEQWGEHSLIRMTRDVKRGIIIPEERELEVRLGLECGDSEEIILADGETLLLQRYQIDPETLYHPKVRLVPGRIEEITPDFVEHVMSIGPIMKMRINGLASQPHKFGRMPGDRVFVDSVVEYNCAKIRG